jgi:putative inorganic carbon (hco3(-)) transporter
VTSAAGLVYTLGSGALIDGQVRLWAGRVDPNFYGVMVAMVAILAIVGFRTERRSPWIAAVTVLLLAMLATLSRAGIIALGSGIVAAVLTVNVAGRRERLQLSSRLLTALFVAVALAVTLVIVAPPVTRVVTDRFALLLHPRADPSGVVRLNAFDLGVEMVREQPLLGTGPGTFRMNTLSSPDFANGAEALNSLLEVAAELGLPAAACLVGLLVWGLARGLRAVRAAERQGDAARSHVALAAWCSLIAGIVGSLTLSNFLYGPVFLLAAVILISAAAGEADPRQ